MSLHETIILSRAEVASLISHEECIEAVEQAFAAYAKGEAPPPGILGVHTSNGAFHIKAGSMQLDQHYFVAKTNGNFPQNPSKLGLPTIQGIIVVCDADNGKLLCVMDSIEISILRTGAATAVAAKYLSRKDSKSLAIWGCGNQGKISARMIAAVRPLEKIFLYDIRPGNAEATARELKDLKAEVIITSDPLKATQTSDICVTCTPSKRPLIGPGALRPGSFLAAVGTDNEHKQEVHADLMKSSKVVTDLTEQAATIGDLHHALVAGAIRKQDVHAELGEVISGAKKGRTNDNEIFIFDSTGMALQDVAAASIVYRKASQAKQGIRVAFGN